MFIVESPFMIVVNGIMATETKALSIGASTIVSKFKSRNYLSYNKN